MRLERWQHDDVRVLFATTAGAGHFGPLIPFATAMRDAGHEVRVAAPGPFGTSVQRAGLEFAPVGERSDAEAAAIFGRLRSASFREANEISGARAPGAGGARSTAGGRGTRPERAPVLGAVPRVGG